MKSFLKEIARIDDRPSVDRPFQLSPRYPKDGYWEGTYWHNDNVTAISGSLADCLSWIGAEGSESAVLSAVHTGYVEYGDDDFGANFRHENWNGSNPTRLFYDSDEDEWIAMLPYNYLRY